MIFGEFTTKAGLIEVEILDGGTNEQVEITGIGSLKYEFDLVPDKPEVTSVQALYEKIDIEITQHGFSKADLYDRLTDNIRSQNGIQVDLTIDGDVFSFFIQVNDVKLNEVERLITLECRVLFDNTTTVLEVFDNIDGSLLKDFVPDSSNATEVLQATGVLDWVDQAMKEVFLNDFDSVIISAESGLNPDYNRTNYTSIAGGPKEKVGFIMAEIIGDDFDTLGETKGFGDTIIYRGNSVFEGTDLLSKIKAGDRFDILRDNYTTFLGNILIESVDSDTQFTSASPLTTEPTVDQRYNWRWNPLINMQPFKAVEALQELAAMEGAIFGTGFGKNFFVNRILHQEIVDIPWDEILEISPSPYWNPFGGGAVTQLARTYTDAENQTLNEGFDNFGVVPTSGGNWEIPTITDGQVALNETRPSDYAINLSLPPGYPFLNKAKWDESNTRFHGRYTDPFVWYGDFEPSIALCRAGLKAMRKALASDGKSLYIELSAYKSKRIKPWNLIRIVDAVGAPAPAKYKDKIFRPTNIECDFVKDIGSYEAYEVLESDIQNPNLQIEVSGNGHASGRVEISVTAKEFINVYGNANASGSVTTKVGKAIQVSGSANASGSVTTDTDVTGTPEPGNVSLILNGTNSQITWTEPTQGQPNSYETQYRVNGGSWNVLDSSVAGGATSDTFDACAIASNGDTIRARVQAKFTGSNSSFVESNDDTLSGCF